MSEPLAAVCARCGAAKGGAELVCTTCGLRPEGEGLLVAWLLSDSHLAPHKLVAVQARIQGGQAVRPSRDQLELARRALGRDLRSDPGMTTGERLGLLAVTLLLTPLPAWVLAAWHWRERRRTALHALGMSLPGSVLGVLVVWTQL